MIIFMQTGRKWRWRQQQFPRKFGIQEKMISNLVEIFLTQK